MKIYHIVSFVFSFFLINLQASNSNHDNYFLIKPAVTIEDVYSDYVNFTKHTNDQRDEFKTLQKARMLGKIPLIGGKIDNFIDNAVTREATRRGYDQSLHALILGIGKLIFSDKKFLKEQLDELRGRILSREPSCFTYLTQAKMAVLDAIKDKIHPKEKLNTTIIALHRLHVEKLQQDEHFSETKKNQLMDDYDVFCNYLREYKITRGTYPPYLFLNMLFLHLLKIHNVVRELK